MDASYITPIIYAVDHVFSTMAQTKVKIGTPRFRDTDQQRHDVSGIIGLSGDVVGTVILSFPTETALALVSRFIGMEISADHEDFADAIGELVNMVTGNAKAKFEGKNVSISCPSVVIGSAHQVFGPKDVKIIEIPYGSDCGDFVVEVSIKEVASGQISAVA